MRKTQQRVRALEHKEQELATKLAAAQEACTQLQEKRAKNTVELQAARQREREANAALVEVGLPSDVAPVVESMRRLAPPALRGGEQGPRMTELILLLATANLCSSWRGNGERASEVVRAECRGRGEAAKCVSSLSFAAKLRIFFKKSMSIKSRFA